MNSRPVISATLQFIWKSKIDSIGCDIIFQKLNGKGVF
jgi:hypothetical protein